MRVDRRQPSQFERLSPTSHESKFHFHVFVGFCSLQSWKFHAHRSNPSTIARDLFIDHRFACYLLILGLSSVDFPFIARLSTFDHHRAVYLPLIFLLIIWASYIAVDGWMRLNNSQSKILEQCSQNINRTLTESKAVTDRNLRCCLLTKISLILYYKIL